MLFLAALMAVLVACGAAPDEPPAGAADGPVGLDLAQSLPPGDRDRGAALANSRDCLACHRDLPTGPPFEAGQVAAIGTRAADRIQQPDYRGQATTAEGYLLESIVNPDVFVVEGYPAGLMPTDFGARLSQQQAADLIAYLSSLQ